MTADDLVSLLHPEARVVRGDADVDAAPVAYVVAPPRRRMQLLRRLRRLGLRPVASFVHVRGAAGEDLLVQLDRRALAYAADAIVAAPAWVHMAPRFVLRAAALVLPRIGVACCTPEAGPLAGWLDSGPLILRRTQADGRARRLVYALGERRLVVKVDGAGDELQRLERHGPPAAAAGARVPQPVPLDDGPAGAAAVTLLEGRPASTTIAAGTVSAADVVARVAAWLERWNVATAAATTVDERLLEREVLAPAALLEPVLADGARYRAWLEQRASAWLGAEVPLVDAHLDLTTANVLLAGDDIAVVDWAEAHGGCLPLVDLLYAAADACAAADSYRDRAAAFRSASYERLVHPHENRIAHALGLQPAVRELCLHATWLHHAVNELRGTATQTPFRRIVEEVARRATAAA